MHKITLGNGTVLEGVTIEGTTCFIQREISRDEFDGGLHEVTIMPLLTGNNSGENSACEIEPGTYKNLKLITCCECRAKKGYYMFEFGQMNEQELKDKKTEARLDYLEMMVE